MIHFIFELNDNLRSLNITIGGITKIAAKIKSIHSTSTSSSFFTSFDPYLSSSLEHHGLDGITEQFEYLNTDNSADVNDNEFLAKINLDISLPSSEPKIDKNKVASCRVNKLVEEHQIDDEKCWYMSKTQKGGYKVYIFM